MKFVSTAVAMLLAANAKDSIKVPLTKRAANKSTLQKHDATTNMTSLASFSKQVTWAPDYIGNIYVGTPGQQQDIVFDSGSGMLIMATDNCTQCSPVKNAKGYYDEYYPSYSSTNQPSIYECQTDVSESAGCPSITYGSAQVQTTRYSDKVCFNGKLGEQTEGKEVFASETSECVEDYPVFAIQSGSGITGGILGLTPACGGLAPNCTPYVKALYDQGTISEPIISFNLGQDSKWLKSMTASLEIGGMEKEYISGKMHTLKGHTNDYWAPVANGMKYDGKWVDDVQKPTEEELQQGTYKMAVMDTGTSLMALPQDILNKLYPEWKKSAAAAGCEGIQADGFFVMTCDCNQAAPHFKDFDFYIDGKVQISMTPYAYLQEMFGTNYCNVAISGIPSSVSGMNMYLLGDTFLRHFYTVLNYDENTVGLALNSQYVKDGYSKTFLQVDKQSLSETTNPEGIEFVRIKEIDLDSELSNRNTIIIAVSSVAGLIVIGLTSLFLYKRNQMKKRAESKDMRDIKQRAAVGFEDSEQTLVQE